MAFKKTKKKSSLERDPSKDLVFIVDDDPAITRLMSIYFNAAGFDTLVAANGVEAMNVWNNIEADLIILDIAMPQMTGIEFCSWLRLQKGNLKVPVIAITAFVDSERREKILRAGASVYLTKPVEMAHLLDIVKQEIRKSRES